MFERGAMSSLLARARMRLALHYRHAVCTLSFGHRFCMGGWVAVSVRVRARL